MEESQYAVVTGCDHGVGLSLVKELLIRGYQVLAVRIRKEEHTVDDLMAEYPGKLTIVTADIGKDEEVETIRERAEQVFPRLDLLINNAGILGDMTRTVADHPDFEEIKQVFNVNALGTLRVTCALIDLLLKGEQKLIVNISSEAGSISECTRDAWFGYCMSKAANNMQGALVHNWFKKRGGTVIQMHPGHVRTFMRGYEDTTGKVSPDESAEGILHTVLDNPVAKGDIPLYTDFEGNRFTY
ncbi:MAG: SDR family NAD(P)-dependent oxidoreductase [Lachnospiraceae bacterium]|nr:SDR family NAD(P)-dependent oxidoreductase [Lachnospiraceae bacterium]